MVPSTFGACGTKYRVVDICALCRNLTSAPMSFTASGHSTGNRIITVICWTQFTIDLSRWLPAFARLNPNRKSSSTIPTTTMAMLMETPAVNQMSSDMSSPQCIHIELRRYHPSSQTAQSIPVWPFLQYLESEQCRCMMCVRVCVSVLKAVAICEGSFVCVCDSVCHSKEEYGRTCQLCCRQGRCL